MSRVTVAVSVNVKVDAVSETVDTTVRTRVTVRSRGSLSSLETNAAALKPPKADDPGGFAPDQRQQGGRTLDRLEQPHARFLERNSRVLAPLLPEPSRHHIGVV